MSSVDNSNVTLTDQTNISKRLDLGSFGLANAVAGIGTFPTISDKKAPTNLQEDIKATRAGAALYVMDSTGRFSRATNKFYLQSLNFQTREKAQLMETFEGSSISFFGEAIKVYNFNGLAVDYADTSVNPHQGFHLSSLIKLYNDELRATKLVASDKICVLKCMNHVITGYPISFQSSYNAAQDKMGSFAMSMVVVSHSLALPSVVSERDLSNLTVGGYDQKLNKKVIQNLTEMLDSINLTIMSQNYGQLKFPDNINVFSNTAGSIWSALDGDDENKPDLLKSFTESIKSKVEAVSGILKDKQTSDTGFVSGTVAQSFGPTPEAIDNWNQELQSIVMDEANRVQGWTEIRGKIQKLMSFRTVLLNYQTQITV